MKGWTVWLHGPVASGKTTIGKALFDKLSGENVILFDGDVLRSIIPDKLGHTREDRCKLAERYVDIRYRQEYRNSNVILCTNSHFEDNRKIFRDGLVRYIEVYLKCPIEVCEKRDHKGLYKGARAGIFDDLPGIGDPIEEPIGQHLTIYTDKVPIDISVREILKCIKERFYM